MKIAMYINTPGQMYLWHNAIPILLREENEVLILARDHGPTCELLSRYGLQYTVYGKASHMKLGKILQLPNHFIKSLDLISRFRPDILIGGGLIGMYISAILKKPMLTFADNEEVSSFELYNAKYFISAIITPSCYLKNLGKNQIRIDGYKELAYLHPNYFKPDPSVYTELGIGSHERYVVLRFGSFEAVHDINRKGFSQNDKYRLVEELTNQTRVFISAEGNLPAGLERYKLPTAYHRIHQVLYFAQLLIGDTGTMAWEAAVLGTPTVVSASFTPHFGNFLELEKKYDLIYCFQDADKAIDKALELIRQPNLKKQWAIKRQKLLDDKIDVTQFMIDFTENFSESFSKFKHGNIYPKQ